MLKKNLSPNFSKLFSQDQISGATKHNWTQQHVSKKAFYFHTEQLICVFTRLNPGPTCKSRK